MVTVRIVQPAARHVRPPPVSALHAILEATSSMGSARPPVPTTTMPMTPQKGVRRVFIPVRHAAIQQFVRVVSQVGICRMVCVWHSVRATRYQCQAYAQVVIAVA